MCSWTNSSVEETTLFILTALLSMDCMNKIDSLSASARKAALIHCSGVCLLNLWFAVRTAARRSLWEALNVLHIWQFWLTFFQSLIFPTALTETYLEVFPVFLLPFFPPFFFFRSCLPEQEQAVDIDRLQCIEVVAESLRASWSGC